MDRGVAAGEQERGHRVLAHTADAILEAWGPDLASCCEEAVAALVTTFVAGPAPEVVEERAARVPAGSAESQLVAVLDELVFTLDTAERVPVGATVEAAGDGSLELVLRLADPAGVHGTGAVPKAVSRSGLEVVGAPGRRSRCRFLVDL